MDLAHEEALEFIETLRETIGYRGLPPEPVRAPHELRMRILEVLRPGEEVLLAEIARRVGCSDTTIVCQNLGRLRAAGRLERGGIIGRHRAWRLPCPG